ncbi:Multi-sensor hybrid histidine kinase [Olavius algarvensis Delta 1 endosymbiont]|nr:Multi-sensor hybrid histidine kinase [Olavius algarvensis Delta 1 endosymbiont]
MRIFTFMRPLYSDVFPEYKDDGLKKDLEVIQTGKPLLNQKESINTFKGERQILVERVPYKDINNKVTGIIGFALDVTDLEKAEKEKRKLEAQLQRSQKMETIGTLAGGIAHDFNNILAIIMGFIEISVYNVEKDTQLYTNLQQVLQAVGRAKDLIKQILTFSRQTAQERKPVQVKLIVNEVLRLLRASLPSTIKVHGDIQSDALVLADPTQIHQVLMNLCTNAGHAMQEEGGVLEVKLVNVEVDADRTADHSSMKPGAYINLTVNDTGCGMPPQVLDRIFDPFFTTKGPGAGTGMGLSVVHGIVRAMSGTIKAYSEPGQGSTFEVYFPVIEKRLKSQVGDVEAVPTGSERILFIDDEPALADIGRQTLEPLGYDVTTRTSSIEALELFKTRPDRFDLVITDMTMPNMTGYKLAAELIRIRPEIRIILCTGYSAKIDEQQAMALGIRAFVWKPVVRRDIATTIRKVLDGN